MPIMSQKNNKRRQVDFLMESELGEKSRMILRLLSWTTERKGRLVFNWSGESARNAILKEGDQDGRVRGHGTYLLRWTHQKYMWNNSYRMWTGNWQKASCTTKPVKIYTQKGRMGRKASGQDVSLGGDSEGRGKGVGRHWPEWPRSWSPTHRKEAPFFSVLYVLLGEPLGHTECLEKPRVHSWGVHKCSYAPKRGREWSP